MKKVKLDVDTRALSKQLTVKPIKAKIDVDTSEIEKKLK
jgi:hypothetical protein